MTLFDYPSMTASERISCFQNYGFMVLDSKPVLDLSVFSSYGFINVDLFSDDDDIEMPESNSGFYLESAGKALGKHIIEPLFNKYSLRNTGFWDGVDKGSMDWHNDYVEGKTLNSSILVYLDEQTSEYGGALFIKGPISSYKIYPAQGTMVWLNQRASFQHKAERSKIRRRLVSFEYWIDDLNY